jgi:hypothetical protein
LRLFAKVLMAFPGQCPLSPPGIWASSRSLTICGRRDGNKKRQRGSGSRLRRRRHGGDPTGAVPLLKLKNRLDLTFAKTRATVTHRRTNHPDDDKDQDSDAEGLHRRPLWQGVFVPVQPVQLGERSQRRSVTGILEMPSRRAAAMDSTGGRTGRASIWSRKRNERRKPAEADPFGIIVSRSACRSLRTIEWFLGEDDKLASVPQMLSVELMLTPPCETPGAAKSCEFSITVGVTGGMEIARTGITGKPLASERAEKLLERVPMRKPFASTPMLFSASCQSPRVRRVLQSDEAHKLAACGYDGGRLRILSEAFVRCKAQPPIRSGSQAPRSRPASTCRNG